MENYTYNQVNDYSAMKEGDYEVVLEQMDRKTTKTGKDCLSLKFRVRTDVEQQYQNKCVFETIWPEKEAPQYFNRKRLNRLLGTQEIKEGQVFPGINDIINFLTGAKMIIHVKPTYDDYRGRDVDTVVYYKKTNFPDKKLISQADIDALPDVSSNDMPF